MKKIVESIEIQAPVELVFDFVADVGNALEWMHGFHKFEPLTEVTRGKGARVRAAGRIGGISISTELEITDFVCNKKLVSVSNSEIKSVSAWLFEPTEKGTRVTFVGHYELPRGSFSRLVGNLWLQHQLAEHAWKSLKNLKRRLESAQRPSEVASTKNAR